MILEARHAHNLLTVFAAEFQRAQALLEAGEALKAIVAEAQPGHQALVVNEPPRRKKDRKAQPA